MPEEKSGQSSTRLRRVEDRLYTLLSSPVYGDRSAVPMDPLRIDLGEHHECQKVAHVSNDGFELLLGYPHEWQFSLSRKQARKLAVGIAYWNVGEWFGLRRWAWYWLLHRRVVRHAKAPV